MWGSVASSLGCVIFPLAGDNPLIELALVVVEATLKGCASGKPTSLDKIVPVQPFDQTGFAVSTSEGKSDGRLYAQEREQESLGIARGSILCILECA